MRRLLLPVLALTACAPQAQPVQVWEGSGRVLLRDQSYRLTFTVNDQTHALRGVLENRTSGVKYLVDGTFLPVQGGAEVTAKVTAGDGAKLNASILGFGVSNVALRGCLKPVSPTLYVPHHPQAHNLPSSIQLLAA